MDLPRTMRRQRSSSASLILDGTRPRPPTPRIINFSRPDTSRVPSPPISVTHSLSNRIFARAQRPVSPPPIRSRSLTRVWHRSRPSTPIPVEPKDDGSSTASMDSDHYSYVPRTHVDGLKINAPAGVTHFTPTFATSPDSGDLPPKLWPLYFQEAQKRDSKLIKNMQEDTNSILIFAGLFSAVVAAFIVESYKLLRLDTGGATVALLSQISQQLANASSDASAASFVPVMVDPSAFHTPLASLRVNVLWFVSLILSLSYALGATLIQHWARRYRRITDRIGQRGQTPKQGRMYAYVLTGSKTFRMENTIEGLPALLHISFVLFFAGMVEFMFPINRTIAIIILALVCVGAFVYLGFTFVPFIYPNSPYATPLTTIWHEIYKTAIFRPFAASILGSGQRLLQAIDSQPNGSQSRRRFFVQWMASASLGSRLQKIEYATARDKQLDSRTVQWTLASLMHRDKDLKTFMDVLTGISPSPPSPSKAMIAEAVLTTPGFDARLAQIIEMPTIDGVRRHPLEQTRFVVSALRTLRSLISLKPDIGLCSQAYFKIMKALDDARGDENRDVAFYAACTSAKVASYLMESMVFERSSSLRTRTERQDLIFSLYSLVEGPTEVPEAAQHDIYHQKSYRLRREGPIDNITSFVNRLLDDSPLGKQLPEDIATACHTLSDLSFPEAPRDSAEVDQWAAEMLGKLNSVRTRIYEADEKFYASPASPWQSMVGQFTTWQFDRQGELIPPPDHNSLSPYMKLYNELAPFVRHLRSLSHAPTPPPPVNNGRASPVLAPAPHSPSPPSLAAPVPIELTNARPLLGDQPRTFSSLGQAMRDMPNQRGQMMYSSPSSSLEELDQVRSTENTGRAPRSRPALPTPRFSQNDRDHRTHSPPPRAYSPPYRQSSPLRSWQTPQTAPRSYDGLPVASHLPIARQLDTLDLRRVSSAPDDRRGIVPPQIRRFRVVHPRPLVPATFSMNDLPDLEAQLGAVDVSDVPVGVRIPPGRRAETVPSPRPRVDRHV